MTSPPPPLLDGLDEAQKICDGTSGKHVCEPEVMLIAHDAFVMLKRIFHGTRQMYDRVAKKRGERDGVEDDAVGRGGGGDGGADTEDSVGAPPPDGDPEPQPEDEGMGTGLYERWTSSDALLACKKMEAFLSDFEEFILEELLKKDTRVPCRKDKDIHLMLRHLKGVDDSVMVPTDKMNRFTPIPRDEYRRQMPVHLGRDVELVPVSRVREIHKQSLEAFETPLSAL